MDNKTGALIETAGQEMQSGVAVTPSGIEIWKPIESIIQKDPVLKIPLPKNIFFALILAMVGHASWNGTFTIFAIYAENTGMALMVEVILSNFHHGCNGPRCIGHRIGFVTQCSFCT